MSDVLVRGLSSQTVKSLKARARRNGRSLQSEAKLILEQASGYTLPDALAAASRWRKKLGSSSKRSSDSVSMIREDRER